MYKLAIIASVFLIGLYFTCKYGGPEGFEGFEGFEGISNIRDRCPDVLIQKGSNYYLHNSKLAKIPGVNPLEFKNLDDYVEFTEWQRSQGIRCPILYLQQSYDAQGNAVYKARPSPTNLQGGLQDVQMMPSGQIVTDPVQKLIDAGRNDPPYNENSYPSYDKDNQYIGLKTPLDKMYNENQDGISPNPMDANWGGRKYTQRLIDSGFYKDDNVKLWVG
jgi:hypothetical protein